MGSCPLYLKANTQIEPLVDQWYAWSHLIPPATAARNVTERHLPIMNSYIAHPDVHAAATRDPKLLGGPYIAYGGERVDEIRALRDRTCRRSHLMELSRALAELNHLVCTEAHGHSVQSLYARVPPALQGFVELVYDLNNHPSFRPIEGLLYRSRYYDSSLQSVMLSTTSGDDRPFVLSTPRLDGDSALHWHVPFADDRLDALFRLRLEPRPIAAIKDLIGLDADAEPLVRSLFGPTPPKPYEPYRGPTARWRYFGHACVLVETPQTSILFDPVLSYTYESSISRYTYLDLPGTIDYMLITHNHQDHVLFETLLQLRHRVRHVVVPESNGSLQDPSLKLMLHTLGFKSVITLGAMEEIPIANGAIKALPFLGEHSDLDISCKSAYLVRLGTRTLVFAADSCNIEPALYRHLRDDIGDVDALFIGMECVGAPLTWLYGPLLLQPMERAMSQSRRLNGSNYEQVRHIMDVLNPTEVYVYAMGQEPWLNHVMSLKYSEASRPIVESNRLLRDCVARGIRAERLFGEREMFINP